MRGDGRIYQRGNVFWICYYLRGKQYRESANTTDQKTARNFLKARLREVGADLIGARAFTTPKANRLTIGDLLGALKADLILRGVFSNQTECHLKRADADFGDIRAVNLTSERVDAYVERRLAEGSKPATVNRPLQLISQSFRLAVKRGNLSHVPYIRHLSEAGNARQGFFTEKEVQAVIAHLPADIQDFVRFGFITGMRKNEICSLTWSDVDGDTLVLRGENSKNGEARAIPLVGELSSLIARRSKARLVGDTLTRFIFHRDGERVGEFRKSWKTACVAVGLGSFFCSACNAQGTKPTCEKCKRANEYRGRIFHDLRRSAVRAMVQAGVNPQVAKKISGHKTDAMFQRYSIVIADDLRAALTQTETFRAASAK